MLPPPETHSLWLSEPHPEFPRFAGELDVEVLVVGGGIAGVTLAYTLAQQGASVGLLEARDLAGAASGRNAGFLMVAAAEPYGETIALWGRPGARAMLEIGRRNHERLARLAREIDVDCGYRRSGSFRLARTEEEAEDQRAALPLLQADGFPCVEVPPAQALPGGPHDRFVAAFVTEEDGELNPVQLLNGVAREAVRLGGRLFTHSPLLGARWQGGLWEARTAGGSARARARVVATNAYAPELCPTLTPLIAPRRGQMLSTAPLPREVAPRPTYAHWGYQYWRQTPDRRLVMGGWRDLDLDGEVGFEEKTTSRIQEGIEAGLRELAPEGAVIEHRWAGIMGFARDGRPLVGWLDATHQLAICAGFTGHGMGLAAGCTQDLAQLLGFRPAPGISTLDPARFEELQQPRGGITALGLATG